MKLNKKQKIMGGILLAGLAALAVDRLVGYDEPSPAAASASVSTSTSSSSLTAAPARSAAVERKAFEWRISQRLNRIAAEKSAALSDPRDVFTPASIWDPPELKAQADAAKAGAPGPEVRFRSRHRLMAVTDGPADVAAAILDGKLIRIGQKVDGFRLSAVKPYTAVFEGFGKTVELHMPRPMVDGTTEAVPGAAPATP